MRVVILCSAALALAAQAASAEDASAPQPAGRNALFYVDCLAYAAAHSTYDRQDGLLRLGCYGATAKAFFDALSMRAPGLTYDLTKDGKHWRFTQVPKKDLYGLDGCWQVVTPTPSTPDYGCLLIYNAGEFLDR